MRRVLLLVIAGLLGLELVLCAGLYWAMSQPPDVFGHVMARMPMPLMLVLPFETFWKHARAGALKPGDPAPDFRLPTLDHRDTVQLSSLVATRPVALIFGSYT